MVLKLDYEMEKEVDKAAWQIGFSSIQIFFEATVLHHMVLKMNHETEK